MSGGTLRTHIGGSLRCVVEVSGVEPEFVALRRAVLRYGLPITPED